MEWDAIHSLTGVCSGHSWVYDFRITQDRRALRTSWGGVFLAPECQQCSDSCMGWLIQHCDAGKWEVVLLGNRIKKTAISYLQSGNLCACIRAGEQRKKMKRLGVPGEHSHVPAHWSESSWAHYLPFQLSIICVRLVSEQKSCSSALGMKFLLAGTKCFVCVCKIWVLLYLTRQFSACQPA